MSDMTIGRLPYRYCPHVTEKYLVLFFAVLTKIAGTEGDGRVYSAHLVRGFFVASWKWAAKYERVASNPWLDVEMFPYRHEHTTPLSPEQIGQLWIDLEAHDDEQASIGLRLLLLTALRPTELRMTRWGDVDLTGERDLVGRAHPTRALGAAIYIDEKRMKMRRPHFVPLSPIAVDLLRRMKAITYPNFEPPVTAPVFPGRKPWTFVSEGPWQSTCYRIGCGRWGGIFVPHAARTTFNTQAREEDRFDWRTIEMSLAHDPRGDIEAHYNQSQQRGPRRALMYWWAEFVISMARAVRDAGNGIVSAPSSL